MVSCTNIAPRATPATTFPIHVPGAIVVCLHSISYYVSKALSVACFSTVCESIFHFIPFDTIAAGFFLLRKWASILWIPGLLPKRGPEQKFTLSVKCIPKQNFLSFPSLYHETIPHLHSNSAFHRHRNIDFGLVRTGFVILKHQTYSEIVWVVENSFTSYLLRRIARLALQFIPPSHRISTKF